MSKVTPLMQAARSGDVNKIKLLLEKDNNLNETDEQGRSALHHAVEASQYGSIQLLLEADPELVKLQDSDGRNVLHLATAAGEVELIKELVKYMDIDSVDEEEHTALHFATVSGLYNCIELLIEHGADPGTPDIHGAYPLHYAAQMCGDPNTVSTGIRCLQALLAKGGSHVNCKDEGGKSPLLWASSAGSSRACKLLVSHGADISIADNDGLTALHCATSRNKSQCLKTLLDDCNGNVDQTDNNGCTALFYAIMMDYSKCVKILLKHGASPTLQDSNGKSPVHCAASRGSVRYLKMLKNHKGHLELPTTSGERPIHEATRAGHNDAVHFLLKRGVGVNARNNDGLTALHIAAETDNLSLCKELVTKGADINAVCTSSKSNQTTAGDLAKKNGCQSCAEYLQYVQDQGVHLDSRTQDSSSSSYDNSSSSSSEDEQECKEKDVKDSDNTTKKIDNILDNHITKEKERKDSFDNQQAKNDISEREAMIKSPNMNNNNSPHMSSVEDEKGTDDRSPTNNTNDSQGENAAAKQIEAPMTKQNSNTKVNQENEAKDERSNQYRKDEGDTSKKRDSYTPSWTPEKLQKKIANWDEYIKGNVEFLDVVIGSKAPELEDIRVDAKAEMKSLVERLETLKREVEDRCKQLVNKMSDKEEARKQEYEAVMKKWEKAEAKFKKSQERIDSAVSEYRAKNQELEAWLDDPDAARSKKATSEGKDNKCGTPTSHSNDKDRRRQQHKAWLREKEAEYLRKKQEVQLKIVFAHTVQSMRAKRALMEHVSMSRNSGKISSRSPLSPRLRKSPFSTRTVDQCPILRRSQNADSSSDDNATANKLTSYDKAQLRRSMGDKITQRMYPKSWEMASERKSCPNADEFIPRWDGGVRPKHKLEFVPRTSKQKQNAGDRR